MTTESEPDMPLGYLLSKATAALRAEMASALAPLGLTFPQYLCLRMLAASPGRSNAELARAVQVSPQSMNTVLQGLQDAGWVSRPSSVSSGRTLPAKLTTTGRALTRRAVSSVQGAEDRLLARLGVHQRGSVRAMLAALGSATPEEAARGM